MVLITLRIVYWDDTVIMILTKRACFRFYGDERIAYYTAHAHKDMESLDDDNVLNLLTEDSKAMHDHNTVNYNSKYHFGNIECNQHLQRDCQKNTDNTCHKWSSGLKEFIGHTIKERNDVIAGGGNAFDQAYIDRFHEADNHALIRTYIETCRRNGINEIMALQRLCSGNPYTVAEIFSESLP